MESVRLERLANGVRVVLVPMYGVESIAVGTYVQTGSRYESRQINGISHFLEHMVFKGTKKFPSHAQTSYLEGLGAIQNAWTDVDATAYWCKIPADRWKEGLEVVKELALYPLFPEMDLEIEKGVIIEEINRREDQPDEIVSEVLMEMLYQNNPLGMTVLGTPEVIRSLKRDDFVKYHTEQYVAGKLVVVLAGKISDVEAVRGQIEQWFSQVPSNSGREFEALVSPTAGSRFKFYKKKTAEQAHFELGCRTFGTQNERRFALAVLTSYLGEGLSSRLFTELREKRGLCYTVHAAGVHMQDTGVWSVYAGVAENKFESAVEAVWEEMQRLTEVPLTDGDLNAAKEKLRGRLIFSKENPISVMEYYARQALDRPDSMLDYDMVLSRLMGVNAEQIQMVARELFRAENMNLAVVGGIEETRVSETLAKIEKGR